jgi:tRNA threonylcarbamoyladenosine biosynthesis protein TsaE
MRGTEVAVPFTFAANDTEATAALAQKLAGICETGDCIMLRGDLGTGKTTFARAFIQSLTGTPEEIVSPTFTLVQTYAGAEKTVWHFDLYRLKSSQELAEIGMEQALQEGISLIEWPELARHLLPHDALDIHITYGSESSHRLFTLQGNAWQNRLEGIV